MKTVRPSFHTAAPGPSLPPAPGTYVLVLRPQQDLTLVVGRLGVFRLPAGVYAYVGSALGAGGIRARVAHHLQAKRRIRWHIDAFTQQCPVDRGMLGARKGTPGMLLDPLSPQPAEDNGSDSGFRQ